MSLRITNNMLGRNLLRNLEAAQGRMDELQSQLSSGLRITKPSDDPVAIESALRVKSSLSRVDQWQKNSSEALAYMNSTDAILGELTAMLNRAKELAVQGANGSLSDDDKKNIAMEINQIMDQFRVVANTQIGTKYIFSGTQTDQPPLLNSLNPDTTIPASSSQPYASPTEWNGNDSQVNYEIGKDIRLPIFVNGEQLFGVTRETDLTDPANPIEVVKVGLFETLNKISAALNNDDLTGLNNAIGEIDTDINRVLGFRAELGARVNRMESLRNQLDSTALNLTEDLSRIQDADIADTIIQFKNQENVYRAALSVGAQIIQPSLVDFMK